MVLEQTGSERAAEPGAGDRTAIAIEFNGRPYRKARSESRGVPEPQGEARHALRAGSRYPVAAPPHRGGLVAVAQGGRQAAARGGEARAQPDAAPLRSQDGAPEPGRGEAPGNSAHLRAQADARFGIPHFEAGAGERRIFEKIVHGPRGDAEADADAPARPARRGRPLPDVHRARAGEREHGAPAAIRREQRGVGQRAERALGSEHRHAAGAEDGVGAEARGRLRDQESHGPGENHGGGTRISLVTTRTPSASVIARYTPGVDRAPPARVPSHRTVQYPGSSDCGPSVVTGRPVRSTMRTDTAAAWGNATSIAVMP